MPFPAAGTLLANARWVRYNLVLVVMMIMLLGLMMLLVGLMMMLLGLMMLLVGLMVMRITRTSRDVGTM